MGYWLWKYFKSRGLTDQVILGTDIIDLPKHGIISNLILELQAMTGNINVDKYLADAILKVEVIGNGSTVIQSLDGKQIQASASYDDLRMPPDKELSPSGTSWAYFDIRFGRYPGDQKYALDCSKWQSLELKITYDLKAGGTIGTTGFVTTTGYTSVYGLYSPDGAGLSPVGFIKKAEKKVYTSSAGGSEERYYIATGSTPFSTPIRWATEGSLGIQGVSSNVYFNVFDMASQAVAVAAATYVSIGISGYCPWGSLNIDLEKQSGKDGVEAMMDCWGYDQDADIHLQHTQASAGTAESIVLEQYAPHPAPVG